MWCANRRRAATLLGFREPAAGETHHSESLVLVVPVGDTVLSSLRTEDGGFGLGNYQAVLSDPQTWSSVRNSLLWVLVALGVTVLGFGFALLSRRVPGLPGQ